MKYEGNRDPRFVARHRGGLLEPDQHRMLAQWAARCAEHVLPLFSAAHPDDERPRRAIETAIAWARGEATVGEAREAARLAHAAARSTTDPAAREAARAAGHAAATAHMADHELGAAAYALRAVRCASTDPSAAGTAECRWQQAQLPDPIRTLVLSDQERRNRRLWSVFSD